MEHHSNVVPWQLCAEKTGAKLKVMSVTKEENRYGPFRKTFK